MKDPFQKNLQYNWETEIKPNLGTIQDVVGGFTPATRGIITLDSGLKVFVKMATDENTTKWLNKEVKSYRILNSLGYEYIPKLLSVNDDESGMVIEYLEDHFFEDTWNNQKLDAVLLAKQELNKYKSHFDGLKDFEPDVRLKPRLRWDYILSDNNIQVINDKLVNLKCDLIFTKTEVEEYKKLHDGWKMNEDSLVHEDIRYDNFGYNPQTKTGKLVDWNWLSIGDESLDTTSLFVSMLKAGFDPYVHHPEKFDRNMVVFLIEFWLDQILDGNEDSSEREYKLRLHQAESLKICVDLFNKNL